MAAVTFDEAEQNIGNPVIAYDLPRTDHGRIERVNPRNGLVGVRVHRRSFPYDLLPAVQWWHPNRLGLKEDQ